MKVANNNGQKVLCAFIQALQGRVTAKDYETITGRELSEHDVFVPMIVAGDLLDRLKAFKLSKRYLVVFVTREQLMRIIEGERGVIDASTLARAINIGYPNYLR